MYLEGYQRRMLEMAAMHDENNVYFISSPRSAGTCWFDEYIPLLIEEPSDKASVNRRKVKERLNLNPRTRKQARWS